MAVLLLLLIVSFFALWLNVWKQSLFLVFKKFKYGVFYGMCYVYSLVIFKRATGIVCYYGVGCLELFGGSFVVVVMEKLGNTGVLILIMLLGIWRHSITLLGCVLKWPWSKLMGRLVVQIFHHRTNFLWRLMRVLM